MNKVSMRSIDKLINNGAIAKIFVAHDSPIERGEVKVMGKDLQINFLYTPRFVDPEVWKEIVARTFCESNSIEERRIHNTFASQINILYQIYGVYNNPGHSANINMLHVYDKFLERMLKTSYSPSFGECNLITSRLEILKKPEVKEAYCNVRSNDDLLYFARGVVTIKGQPWSSMVTLWGVLTMINRQYEAMSNNPDLPKQLIAVEERMVTPHALEGTLRFIAEKGKTKGLILALIKGD